MIQQFGWIGTKHQWQVWDTVTKSSFPNSSLLYNIDCACDVLGTKNGTSSICDPETKQCDCNCAIEGISCNTCIDKHFNFPECEENRKLSRIMLGFELWKLILYFSMQLWSKWFNQFDLWQEQWSMSLQSQRWRKTMRHLWRWL